MNPVFFKIQPIQIETSPPGPLSEGEGEKTETPPLREGARGGVLRAAGVQR